MSAAKHTWPPVYWDWAIGGTLDDLTWPWTNPVTRGQLLKWVMFLQEDAASLYRSAAACRDVALSLGTRWPGPWEAEQAVRVQDNAARTAALARMGLRMAEQMT